MPESKNAANLKRNKKTKRKKFVSASRGPQLTFIITILLLFLLRWPVGWTTTYIKITPLDPGNVFTNV